MFVFQKIWRALFFCNPRFEICLFTLWSMSQLFINTEHSPACFSVCHFTYMRLHLFSVTLSSHLAPLKRKRWNEQKRRKGTMRFINVLQNNGSEKFLPSTRQQSLTQLGSNFRLKMARLSDSSDLIVSDTTRQKISDSTRQQFLIQQGNSFWLSKAAISNSMK